MRRRARLTAFLAAAALTTCIVGAMRMWGAHSLAQVTPVGDVRWEGYRIEHVYEGSRLSPFGHGYDVHVFHGDTLALDDSFSVYDPWLAGGPVGFFGGLDADGDDELELVQCGEGVVISYLEPDRATGGVSSRPGHHASASVRDLCAAVGRAGSVPGWGCVLCALPLAVLLFLVLLSGALRERREEKEQGPTAF